MCVFQKENYDFNKRSIENNGQISTNKNGIIEMDNLEFKVKLSELKDLMELKSIEAKQKILDDHGSIETFINKLHTNIQDGIPGTKEDIEKRKKLYGKNEIPAKAPKSIFYLAFEAVQDPTLIMLIICSIISIGLSFYHPSDEKLGEEYALTYAKNSSNLEWVEGAAIMIAVIVVVFVTAFNDWRKERQFRGLKDKLQQDQMASVIRSGNSNVRINVRDLVVGDMCHIKYGDLIPADGIVVQANDLKIDESALTGETDLIRKDDSNNIIVLSGTHVMEGSGRFMVTAVGLYSQTGIIMTLLGATDINEINDETIASENSIKNKKNGNFI
jgi:Ca2+ transporting ATPase